jgi:hypothetical protein
MSQPYKGILTKLSFASMPVSWQFGWADSPVNSITALQLLLSYRLTLLPRGTTEINTKQSTCVHLQEGVTGISITHMEWKGTVTKDSFLRHAILGHLMRHDYQKALTDYRDLHESKKCSV